MIDKNFNASIIKDISELLDRDISHGEESTVESFASFKIAELNDIRTIGSRSSVFAIWYIRYRLKEKINLDTAVSFYSEVIQKGTDISKWIDSK